MRYTLLLLPFLLFTACKSKKEAVNAIPIPAFSPRDSINAAKLREGISWYALGDEPGWSLQIKSDGSIAFNDINGNQRKASLSEKILLNDGAGFRYVLQTETGLLEVRFWEKSCIDKMSGENFPFEVAVKLDYTSYTGCGGPTFNHRIQDSWVVAAIDGNPIYPQNDNKIPLLSMIPEAGKIAGNDGCNQFTGKFYSGLGKIEIGPLAITKMACKDSLDQIIQKFLSQGSFNYQLLGQQMELTGKNGQIMLLNRPE
jgi:heat shock protein HslJ